MTAAFLVALTLLNVPPFDQLKPIEDEMAELQTRRVQVERDQGLASRDTLDRRVTLLKRVHERSIRVIQRRTDVCVANLGGDPPRLRDSTEQQRAMFCASRVGVIVPRVLELEEIKERLATEQGTMANVDERRALQKKVRDLEAEL
ncbi:MAG: hypothetical protein ABIJ09_05935 [Pseudomonadota bacterium]